MSGGTLGGLSGSGVAIAKATKPTNTTTTTTNSNTSKTSTESEKLTVTGAPGAQQETTGENFSNRLASDMAVAAANPYVAPAATAPTQQGMDPAMMAMMSGMGQQKQQSPEQGGSKASPQGSQAQEALKEMAQRFSDFRDQAGKKIAELTQGNKESPGDKVVEKALEKLTGKPTEPEAKKGEEKKPAIEVPGDRTSAIDYDGDNGFTVT